MELAQLEQRFLPRYGIRFTPAEGGASQSTSAHTVVAQLVDPPYHSRLGVRTALNNQARAGADIMSRIEFAVSQGQPILQR